MKDIYIHTYIHKDNIDMSKPMIYHLVRSSRNKNGRIAKTVIKYIWHLGFTDENTVKNVDLGAISWSEDASLIIFA